MKSIGKPYSMMRLITLFLFMFLASTTFAQSGSGDAETPKKSLETEAFDQKALGKLREMTPQEVEELDKKLAEALTLFYDREYARALPIFREISDLVETMDVIFWYATCAAKAGETELSIRKFRQMLEIDPRAHRVRLELAGVYFEMAQYDNARKELNRVLDEKPPDAVKNNIQRLLAAIDEKTKRLYTNLRVSMGFQRDSNVSAGPDKETILIPQGGTLTLNNTQRSLSDYVSTLNAAGNALYDFGEKGEWMWNTTASFYNSHNLKYYQFDFLQWRLTTGLWWIKGKSILKLPVGYAENVYEHDHLFDTVDISPSYEYFFTPNFSLKTMLKYSKDVYEPTVPPNNRSEQDVINRIVEFNPNLYFNNRKDILSFYVSKENANSRSVTTDRRYTYNGLNLAVSHFKRFSMLDWDMELYSRFKFSSRHYATPALLWPAAHLRHDSKYSFYTALSRNFGERYFASVSYNFVSNESNTELYDYEKDVWGINFGFKY